MSDIDQASMARLSRSLEIALSRRCKVKILTPLPLRTRFRLWRDRQVNSVAIWFAAHDHPEAAMWTWKITGRWDGAR